MRYCACFCAALIGCSATEVTRIDLAADDYEVGFLVVLESDEPTRISPAFVVGATGDVTGTLPAEELGSDETAVVVGFPRQALQAQFTRMAVDRIAELRLEVGVPPVERDLVAEIRTGWATVAVPDSAMILDGSTQRRLDASLQSKLQLVIPIDPEPCRIEGQDRLQPYAARADIINDDEPYVGFVADDRHDSLRGVVPVTEDRLVVMTRKAVLHVRRGLPLDGGSYTPGQRGNAIPLFELFGQNDDVRAEGIAVGPNGRRVLVVGHNGVGIGQIWTFDLDDEGLLYTGNATISGPAPVLVDVAIDDQGRAVAVGAAGYVAGQEAPDRPFEPKTREGQGVLQRVIATGDPTAPHLMSADDGGVFRGDVFAGTVLVQELKTRRTSLEIEDFHSGPNGEVWAVGRWGSTYRFRPDEAWISVALIAPPRFDVCANIIGDSTSEFEPLGAHLQNVAGTREHFFLSSEACDTVLQVRRDDFCVSLVTPGEHALFGDTNEIKDMASINGMVIVAARNGVLLQVDGFD